MNECWRDRGLCCAQQESDGDKTTIIRACRSHCDDGAPEQGVDPYIFSNREFLDQKRRWVFPEEIAEIEDT